MQEGADVPQRPTERSHVGIAKVQTKKRPSFRSGEKARMKNNSTGVWDWRVTIAGAGVWNPDRHGYDYEVKDASGVKIDWMVAETDLKDA